MDLTMAFWYVFHKIFRWRPIILGCCDCKGAFYLTKNKVIDTWHDDKGDDNPVIECPWCGLTHYIILVRIEPGTKPIKFETVVEDT